MKLSVLQTSGGPPVPLPASQPGALACAHCERLRRRVDGLGRLRFELHREVNRIEARARAAEARAAELERRLERAETRRESARVED